MKDNLSAAGVGRFAFQPPELEGSQGFQARRNMAVCQHVVFSGRVQGVGFRYTTERLAERFHVNGYVRNLANGDVELVAEGQPAEVQAFLQAVAERMAAYIAQARVQDEAPAGYRDFTVRY